MALLLISCGLSMGFLAILGVLGLIVAIYRGEFKEWVVGLVKWMGVAFLIGTVLFLGGAAFMLYPKFVGLVFAFGLIGLGVSSIISGAVEDGIRNSKR